MTVCATANPCYSFVNWTVNSNVVSTSLCYAFSAATNETLVANFAVNDGPNCGSPTNRITGVQFVGTNAIITVMALPGETYQLQFCNSLTPSAWSNVPGVFVTNAVGGPLTLTNFGGSRRTTKVLPFAHLAVAVLNPLWLKPERVSADK